MEEMDIFVRLSCNEALQRRRVPLGSIGFRRLPWGSLGVPWRFLGGSLEFPWGSMGFVGVPTLIFYFKVSLVSGTSQEAGMIVAKRVALEQGVLGTSGCSSNIMISLSALMD